MQPATDPAQLIRTILAEPRFRDAIAPYAPADSPLQQILHRIGKARQAIWHKFASALGHALSQFHPEKISPIFAATIAICIVVILGTLGVATARLVRRSHRQSDESIPKGTALPMPTVSAEEFARYARAKAARSEFDQAIAYAFLSAVKACDELGLVAWEPALTAHEYKNKLRARDAPAVETFAILATYADECVFTGQRCEAPKWEAANEALTRFRSHIQPS